MRKVVLTTLAILIVAAFTFGGCKGKKPEPTSPPTPTSAKKTTQTPTEKPKPAALPTEKPASVPAEKPAGK